MASDDREPVGEPTDPVDNLIVSLRSYIERVPEKKKGKKGKRCLQPWDYDLSRAPPSDWGLVFDCETRTTPDQRLRFGGYQLRYRGQVWERGAFYEPDVLTAREIAVLRGVLEEESAQGDGTPVKMLNRSEFVDRVFYQSAFQVGAQIVGLNLPFDLSRLAIRHASARGGMRGGFSLVLSEKFPAVAVKHLSQRTSFIRFTGTKPESEDEEDPALDEPHEIEKGSTPDRGYFVDVKTLAAALTGASHSLASLSEILQVPTPKKESEDHGGELTPEYVRYGLRDVQTTWECFDALSKRFQSYQLHETELHELYSQASLGKAYLKAMNVLPWRQVQPDLPPALIGLILSAYYGGRSEVQIRREITPVIHCDFLSMYPTVCTLMGMWKFVTATGVDYKEDTQSIRDMLAASPDKLVKRLLNPNFWRELAVLVQVLPERDRFPIRAEYPSANTTTIGLNYLTGDEPFWYTLADVLVSKILTGKTPNVLSAIRFTRRSAQTDLKPITIAGETIDPKKDDFYRRLIIHRNALKQKIKTSTGAKKRALESEELGVKILANATSYGIFLELNAEDYRTQKWMIGYGSRPRAFRFKSGKFEKPGRYFYPLLGTLITGAARLMLALAEFQVSTEGLSWAFCDTDSIAIANTSELSPSEFKQKALAVVGAFTALNPYGENRSILKIEDVNFPLGEAGDLESLDPPVCLAVSAKRYVLFNRSGRSPVIRKASGHGLGHLVAPYDEPPAERRARIKRIGVPLWQEDLWKEVIRAAETDTPDQTRFMDMPGFDGPAASQYAATTPELLKWFKGYNERQRELGGDEVFPFGFLLSLQAKSRIEMAKDEREALSTPLWQRREPRPAAPFFRRPIDAVNQAFDRERYEKIPATWLKSLGRSLVRYHLHEETKFWGGEYEQRGTLRRRRVSVLVPQFIGKEADHTVESEFIGEDAGPEEYPPDRKDRPKLAQFIAEVQREYAISDRELCSKAHVSHHTLAAVRERKDISNTSLRQVVRAAEALRQEAVGNAAESQDWLERLKELREKVGGRNKLAKLLGVSATYLGRVLSGERRITEQLIGKLAQIRRL